VRVILLEEEYAKSYFLQILCKQGYTMLVALSTVFAGKPLPLAWGT
jgi:hypothetical protein